MDLKLTGKLAFISGSTAGIGHAIAASLAREGARVIVNGREQSSVDEAVSRITAAPGGEMRGFAGDMSTPSAASALVERFPEIEILVNNLGIFEPKAFDDIPDEDWRRFFDATSSVVSASPARRCEPG